MGLRSVFCPNCGMQTKINDEKEACFCINCGHKIPVKQKNGKANAQIDVLMPGSMERQLDIERILTVPTAKDEIETKLQEVAFYYNLSKERKEPHKALQENPYFYLKAQDLLLELTKIFPEDDRVWWELSKPIDFDCTLDCVDIQGQYGINDEYFNKALDLADLEKKRFLIQERDRYEHDKRQAQEELKRKQQKEEEEKHRQQQLEKDRLRRLEAEKAEAEEKRRRLQEEEEDKRQKEIFERQEFENTIIWEELFQKDFSRISECYFTMSAPNGQMLIGIFRIVSNILYLLSVRIDVCRGGVVYKDQTLPIQFNSEGMALKYDNKAVRIRNVSLASNEVRIHGDGDGKLFMNQMELIKDKTYIDKIIKSAKKPLLPYSKVFV